MTLYVYRSQNNKEFNRPVKTRLLISVRFVPTVTESRDQHSTDIVSGTLLNPDDQCAQADVEAGQSAASSTEPDDLSAQRVVRTGLAGAFSMRLRLVAPNASTKKEYSHAKSLSA
jgi:hypothetical protein